MTPPDDAPYDDSHRHGDGEAAKNASDAQPEPEPAPRLPLDEEAAWLQIVENYGDRPTMGPGSFGDRSSDGETAPAPPPPSTPSPPSPGRPTVDRSYLDALDAARSAETPHHREPDEHFVPPEPPPIPRGTPARRIAWCCLFGAPLLMLIGVVLGRSYPMWASVFLVAAFVGGFVFLIATMPRTGGDDHDDGAVV